MISNYYKPTKLREFHEVSILEHPSSTDLDENLRATCPSLAHSSMILTKKSESEYLQRSSVGECEKEEGEKEERQ